MPYKLTPDEPITEGLRRIVREEVDFSMARLRQAALRTGDPDSRAQCIHEARKSIKKLRGAVRLLMPAMGDAGKRENIALRDAGRLLSAFRDAAALIETVDDMRGKYSDDPAAEELVCVRAVLVRRKNEAEKRNDIAGAARKAIERLSRFKRRVSTWPEGEDEFSMLEAGLRKTYRRGRKALARVVQEGSAVNFHEFRKRVKDHWYHVRLLDGIAPPARLKSLAAREKSLKELQDWIGEDHNLVLLEEIIAEEPPASANGQSCSSVLRLIDKYRVKLREKALSHGERLYAEKPREFMRELKRLRDAWQKEAAS
jgi:CHAD domain-containing protein